MTYRETILKMMSSWPTIIVSEDAACHYIFCSSTSYKWENGERVYISVYSSEKFIDNADDQKLVSHRKAEKVTFHGGRLCELVSDAKPDWVEAYEMTKAKIIAQYGRVISL